MKGLHSAEQRPKEHETSRAQIQPEFGFGFPSSSALAPVVQVGSMWTRTQQKRQQLELEHGFGEVVRALAVRTELTRWSWRGTRAAPEDRKPGEMRHSA